MKTPSGAGASLPGASAPATLTLLEVVRNPRLYPALRALLRQEVSRLNFPGALKHFTYRDAGDEIVVGDDDLKVITHAIAAATGNPRLRLATSVLHGREGETTLRLSAKAERTLLLELLAQAAHLSADDLAKLPPPVDLAPAATNN